MNSNKALSEKLYDATARIETIFHLGCMLSDGCSVPPAIKDLLEDGDNEMLERMFPGIPEDVIESLDDYETDEFVEWLYMKGKFGFLVQFATPVMKHHSEDHRSYSWGLYNTQWFYAETLEETIEKGLEWVVERRAKEKSQ